MNFNTITLDNGLTVIAELNPAVHSVAVGFFVKTGSRDETDEVSGVSHFLEHMVFKGTETRTAEDVNRVFDEMGAQYNASTSEEVTLFYAAILPEYLPDTFGLLSDILYPSLRDEDFDMEKKVILEEIGMYDDMPSFTAYESAMQSHFSKHPLGQSILGSTDSIEKLSADQMRAYHQDRYKAGNIIVAVAGNAHWQNVVKLAEKHCNHWPAGKGERDTREAQPKPSSITLEKEGALQENIMQMAPAPSAKSPLRFAAELLGVIIGDDSGSRMYWELVDPGHAESAEIGYNEYDGSGTYLTYLCCEPDQVEANLKRIESIYAKVNSEGVTEEELEQAKSKVCSRIVLRSERPMGRLSSLGNNWIYREEYCSVEDDLRIIRNLTPDHFRELLDAYPLAQTTTVGIGPLKQFA